MATYAFQQVLVWDVVGGAVHTVRDTLVTVRDVTTHAVVTTVTTDSNGVAAFTTVDRPTVDIEAPGGFRRRVTSEDASVAAFVSAAAASATAAAGSAQAAQDTATALLQAVRETPRPTLTPGASGGGTLSVGSIVATGPTVDVYDAFPGCARLLDGTLVMVWRTGPAHTGGTDGRIYLSKSLDQGRTWSTPVLVRDETLDLRDPSITVSRDGSKWWVTYFTYNTPGTPDPHSYVITSTDSGATWGSPVSLSVSARAICSPIVEAADGTLYAALYGSNGTKDAAYSVTSTNGGASWSVETTIGTSASIDYQEPALVATPAGLVAMMRYNSVDGVARSLLTGGTWSTPTRMFDGTGAPRTTRTATGALVCVYRSVAAGAAALARASLDNGATWGSPVTVDAATTQMVYASPVEVAPGMVCVPYAVDVPGGADLRVRYVVDGTGMTPFGDVTAMPASNTGALLAYDDFERADGALGNTVVGAAWTAANYTISTGRADPSDTGTARLAVVNVAVADYQVEAVLRWVSSSGIGIVFRYVDASNYLFLASESAGVNQRLYKVVAGTATQLATSTAVTTTDGVATTYRAVVSGNVIRTYIGGVLIHSFDMTGDAHVATFAGKTVVGLRGFRNVAGTHHYADSFTVRALA